MHCFELLVATNLPIDTKIDISIAPYLSPKFILRIDKKLNEMAFSAPMQQLSRTWKFFSSQSKVYQRAKSQKEKQDEDCMQFQLQQQQPKPAVSLTLLRPDFTTTSFVSLLLPACFSAAAVAMITKHSPKKAQQYLSKSL